MINSTDSLTARPTTYRGVRMRSRLEAGFASWLDREKIKWKYEPECFGSEQGQYLPDFRLDGVSDSGPVYVEVKPAHDLERIVFAVMHSMSIIRASEPAAVLAIASPNDLAFWSFPALTAERWDVHIWRRCVDGCGALRIVLAADDPLTEGPCGVCQANSTTILSPWAGQPFWMSG